MPGIPSEEDTWSRWSQKTGRELTDLDYWSAFGASRHRRDRVTGDGAVGPRGPVRRGVQRHAAGVGVAGGSGDTVNADDALGPPTNGCTRPTRQSGRGTNRGTSRGSTSTAARRGSSGSGCCRTRTGPCSGATCTATGSGSAPRRPDCASTTSISRTAWRTTVGGCASAGARDPRPRRFEFDGSVRTVTGPDAGALVPLSLRLRGDADHRSVRHRHRR